MEEEKVKHVGQILKDYRLKKKITIEKISNKTKISIQNLINIEEGNLDDIEERKSKYRVKLCLKEY